MPRTPEEAFQALINEAGWHEAHKYLYAERDALRLPANSARVIANAIATYRADKANNKSFTPAESNQGDLFT